MGKKKKGRRKPPKALLWLLLLGIVPGCAWFRDTVEELPPIKVTIETEENGDDDGEDDNGDDD